MKKTSSLLFLCCVSSVLFAQVYSFDEKVDSKILSHRILMDEQYFIETVFDSANGAFVLTRGGFYTQHKKTVSVSFEFNSNIEADQLKTKLYRPDASWKKISKTDQLLEEKWLMAGRVKPEGEQRRDLNRSRKTMKLLLDGYFQWIAFDTSSFRFMGSGGGTYTAKKGTYVETLDYFSRDNSKVGKVLPFTFTRKNNDWYHQGLNSKGNPMHEIWHWRNGQ
ncbi:MAG: hypothetical protein ACPIA1_04480 [Flavobacteriaceae bacterium]